MSTPITNVSIFHHFPWPLSPSYHLHPYPYSYLLFWQTHYQACWLQRRSPVCSVNTSVLWVYTFATFQNTGIIETLTPVFPLNTFLIFFFLTLISFLLSPYSSLSIGVNCVLATPSHPRLCYITFSQLIIYVPQMR